MFHLNYPHRLITNALTYTSVGKERKFNYTSKTTGVLVFYINVIQDFIKAPFSVRFKNEDTGWLLATQGLAKGINYFHFLCNKDDNLAFYLTDETFYKELAIIQYPLTEHYRLTGSEKITDITFRLNYGNKIQTVSKIHETDASGNSQYRLTSPTDGLFLASVSSYSISSYITFQDIVIQDNHMYHSYLVNGLNVCSCFCSKKDEIIYTLHKDIQEAPQFIFVPFLSPWEEDNVK